MWPHGGSTAAWIPPTEDQTWTLNDLKTLEAFGTRLNVWMSGEMCTKYMLSDLEITTKIKHPLYVRMVTYVQVWTTGPTQDKQVLNERRNDQL